MPWKQKPFGWGKALSGESLFPPVQGATVAVLDQVRDIVRADSMINGITFKLNTLEPPSVELAIQSMLDQTNSRLEFTCVADAVPGPDPRMSSAAKINLWDFSEDKPKPALPAPNFKFPEACSSVVLVSKDCVESWSRAKERAYVFGVDQVESILSVMVYPPPIAEGFEATEWVRRVQFVACQMAANVEVAYDVPISESMVADVTNGPLDWTIDSAMVALAQRASENHELIDEVRSIVQRVADKVPADGTWSSATVAENVLRFLDCVVQLNHNTVH